MTLIANYVPLESPDGGPNFYEFGDDVLYEINIDNIGDGLADIVYQFQFHTETTNPNTFVYNTAPILSLTESSWNRRQTYTVSKVEKGGFPQVLGFGLPCPPCNIGPLSTPDYLSLVQAATKTLGTTTVFAGQRAEGFYVDLGAILDLGILRPFEEDHTTFSLSNTGLGQMAAGVNSTAGVNVHSIVLQVPIDELTCNGTRPSKMDDPNSVIGVWTTASRQKASLLGTPPGQDTSFGPFVQVSRLGNPLVNEVVIAPGPEGLLELPAPGARQPVRRPLRPPRAVWLAADSLPRRLRQPGRLQHLRDTPERPGGRPAHWHPVGAHPRLSELHRPDPGGHAPAQRVDPAERKAVGPRSRRRRLRRLAQRSPGVRRRRHHRAAGLRWLDHSAGGHELQARRRRRRNLHGPHLRPDRRHGHGHRELPAELPLPRDAVPGLRGPVRSGQIVAGAAGGSHHLSQ